MPSNFARRLTSIHALIAVGALLSVMTVLTGQLLAAPASERRADAVMTTVPASVIHPEWSAAQALRATTRIQSSQQRTQGGSPLAVHGPGQATDLLEDQKFEDAAFPPKGWIVLDAIALRANKTEPERTWSRETCDVDRTSGGLGAAWSFGGGTIGKTQTPCSNYNAPLDSRMVFEKIDTSNYLGGLRVNLRFKMELPRNPTFQICAPNNDSTQTYSCYRPDGTSYPAWTTFRDWLTFPKAAELTAAEIALIYQDATPVGTFYGAYIDNFKIEGIFEAAAPTVSPTPRNTNTPRNTSTPRSSATLAPRPTTVRTPTPAGRQAFLPIAARDVKTDELPAANPLKVWVEFGTSVDRNTGFVGERGTRFEYGIMRLCGKTEWSDLAVGTKVSWVWQYWDGGSFVSYEDPPYKDSEIIAEGRRFGFKHLCIGNVDANQNPIPIDVGKFRLQAALNDVVSASQIVEIVPGAATPTTRPTDEPTPGPDMTQTPEPEPTDAGGTCRQRLVNGNFESGPTRGWTLRSNSDKGNDVAKAIVHDKDSALEGEWLAVLGGGLNVQDELHSSALISLFEPDKIISASLSFAYAMNTEEVKDGKNDDVMAPFWANQDNKVEQVPNSGISEELVDNRAWYRFRNPIDVTSQVIKREGWTSMHLLFFSQNSAAKISVHAIDDVQLTVCTPALMNTKSLSSAREGKGWMAVGGTGLRPPLALDGPWAGSAFSWLSPDRVRKVQKATAPQVGTAVRSDCQVIDLLR